MASDTDRTLEVDTLDHDLELSPNAAPVVLVQYRNRGVPFWLVIPMVLIVALSAISIYHRFVVVQYRAEAALARRALESQLGSGSDRIPDAAVSPSEPKPAEPLANNSHPFVPEPVPVAPTPTAASPTPVPALASSAPSAVSANPSPPIEPGSPSVTTVTKNPDLGTRLPDSASPRTGSGALLNTGLLSMPAANESQHALTAKSAEPPAQSSKNALMVSSQESDDAPVVAQVADRNITSETAKKKGTAWVESARRSTTSESRVEHDDSSPATQEPSGDQVDETVKVAPLPSKEESLRQIDEEAAKKQAEIDGFEVNKRAELRSLRLSERVKFREELRALIQTLGSRAGPEIDTLAQRNGYDIDRATYLRARNAWKFARMSTESKVRFTRSLDLPEATILNFLSADLDLQVGTREGPRNRNEVRIRAAKLLLNFELSAPTASTSVNPSGRLDSGIASSKTPQRERGTASHAVVPRSQ